MINSSAGLFPSAVPKFEINLDASAWQTYSNLIVMRAGNQPIATAVARQMGLLFKLSAETDTNESQKSGGIMVESSSTFANSASLSLITLNTRRLTIDSSGLVGIANASPQAALDVVSTGTASALIVPRATTGNRPTTLVNGMIRYNTTTTLFEFYQNGVWVNYTTVSDERLKTNIEPVQNGLDIVKKLNPVFYDWDRRNPKTAGFEDKHQVGFLAQEVEKVLPEVVNKGEDSYRSLEYGKIVSVVVAAVKELYNKIIESENELKNLKREVASIKEQSAEQSQLEMKIKKLETENMKLKSQIDQQKIEKAAFEARLEKIEKSLRQSR